mmetsp:Transcript_12335/g.28873  ORF Transcript_12335/g.28873 Transcript_12335/m.28873 type:complete len:438 (+) Transcript_12335:172-1485(+)
MIKGAGPGVLAELIKPKHAIVKHKALFKPDCEEVEEQIAAMAMPPTVLPNKEVVPGTREVHRWKAAADEAQTTPGALLKPAANGETDPYDIARAQGHATDSFGWLQREVGPVHLKKHDLQHLGGLKVDIWQCENCMARNHHHNLECELCHKPRHFVPGEDVVTPYGAGLVLSRDEETGLYQVGLSWKMGISRVAPDPRKPEITMKKRAVAKAWLNAASLRYPDAQTKQELQATGTSVRFFTIMGSWLENGDCALQHFNEWLPHVVENDSDTELLQLSYAGIGNAGSKALAAGLVLNNYIHTINIAGNGIGARGAKALGKGLAGNESVVNLVLDNNNLGNEGVCLLLRGLEKNSTLEELRLDNNEIDDTTYAIDEETGKMMGYPLLPEMKERLERNHGIRTLSLVFNQLQRRLTKSLFKAALINDHPRREEVAFEVII